MELSPLYAASFAVGTTVSLLLLFRLAHRAFSPLASPSPSPSKEAQTGAPGAASSKGRGLAGGNTASHLLDVGQVLGVFLVAAAVVKNCVRGADLGHDLAWASAFGVLGLVLVGVTGRLGTQLLLQSALPAEIARGNVAAGIAGGAHYVAAGVVAANALAGTKLGDLALSSFFYGIAIVTLWLFVTLFRALTTYDDAEQIRGENLAAALSYAGLSIAVAIIVGTALDGDFVSWAVSLRGYAVVLAFAFALYPVRQLFVQTVLLGAPLSLRGGRLDAAIGVERSEGLGALEAATYVATALTIARLA